MNMGEFEVSERVTARGQVLWKEYSEQCCNTQGTNRQLCLDDGRTAARDRKGVYFLQVPKLRVIVQVLVQLSERRFMNRYIQKTTDLREISHDNESA